MNYERGLSHLPNVRVRNYNPRDKWKEIYISNIPYGAKLRQHYIAAVEKISYEHIEVIVRADKYGQIRAWVKD